MGLGHLRAADSLARALGVPLLHVDRAPLSGDDERRRWAKSRRFYELVSRVSQLPFIGAPPRGLLSALTHIPHLHPRRDLSRPSLTLRYLERQIVGGLGGGLVAEMERTGAPLLTTFFAPALVADRRGAGDVNCLVTDSDIARVWVPSTPAQSRIRYFAPTERAQERLCAYGVAPERITLTGFPLPGELLGGPELPVLRRNLAARLVRLDPTGVFREPHGPEVRELLGPQPGAGPAARQAPLLTFAVGGAGAQAGLAPRFLPVAAAGRSRRAGCGWRCLPACAATSRRRCARWSCARGRPSTRALAWSATRISTDTSAPATSCSARPTSCGPSRAR